MEMELESDNKFLETNVMVVNGYHMCAVHRNPGSHSMVRDLELQNFRMVPSNMFSTRESLIAYVIGILARIEANCTFPAHIILTIYVGSHFGIYTAFLATWHHRGGATSSWCMPYPGHGLPDRTRLFPRFPDFGINFCGT
eukprot:SAG11_NODE_3534_length_2386_cov_3.060778_4_plen_140_part_00